MSEQTNQHFITRTDGPLKGRYFGSLDDQEFDLLMDKLGNELPKGFSVYHIPQSEIDTGSKRVAKLKELGLITTFSPFVEGGTTYASPEVQMLRAKQEQDLEKKEPESPIEARDRITIPSELNWTYGDNGTQHYYDSDKYGVTLLRNYPEKHWFAMYNSSDHAAPLSLQGYEEVDQLVAAVDNLLRTQ